MHCLLIVINNSSNGNGESSKDKYLCLVLHIRKLCLSDFQASFVINCAAQFPLIVDYQCIFLQWFQAFN